MLVNSTFYIWNSCCKRSLLLYTTESSHVEISTEEVKISLELPEAADTQQTTDNDYAAGSSVGDGGLADGGGTCNEKMDDIPEVM